MGGLARIARASVLAIGFASPSWAVEPPSLGILICTPKVKAVCGEAECRAVNPVTFARIDLQRSTYARCDGSGCDTYDARMTRSGVFTNIEVPERGLLAKVGDDGGFLEVASLGLDAYVSRGRCQIER